MKKIKNFAFLFVNFCFFSKIPWLKSFALYALSGFFLSACSPIGFYSGQKAGQKTASSTAGGKAHLNSRLLECDEKQINCLSEGEQTPFLRKRHFERAGFLREHFEITGRNELEIVIIVDTSESMDDNLRKTGKNLRSLLSFVQDKTWRVVFTTADHGDHETGKSFEKWQNYKGDMPRFGKLMRLEKRGKPLDQFILSQDTPEYEQIFKDTLTRENSYDCSLAPYCQGPNEQPLRALKALFLRYKKDPLHRRFFQPNVDTWVLIITDEDERRKDFQNATTAEQVIQTYESLFKGQNKRLFGFSISVQDKKCYESENGFFSRAAYGHIVGRLPQLTGGINLSLCAKDYGKALAHISRSARSLMESSLTLQKLFIQPDSVQVRLNPDQPHVSWKLTGRKIKFSQPLEPNTKISVSYNFD